MSRTLDRLTEAFGTLAAHERRYWARPVGPLSGPAAEVAIAEGDALPLAGDPRRAFGLVEIIARPPGGGPGVIGTVVPIGRAYDWATANGTMRRLEALLACLSRSRPSWAGFTLDRPLLMGIINVTPDSFSDGGEHDQTSAIEHGKRLIAAGADVLDVGGESTRPGAAPVDPAEEIRRIEPVIRALGDAGATVSVDTRHAATMDCALSAGARIINDVSALTGDTRSLEVAARSGASVVLMHMRGEPRTMQEDPIYDFAPLDVLDYLERRIEACEAAGITPDRIAVDPGVGFGKRLRHNLEILGRLSLLHLTGCPLLLGVSRKALISSSLSRAGPKERLPGSLAASCIGLDHGVHIFRVHDVAETVQAIQVWRGIRESG